MSELIDEYAAYLEKEKHSSVNTVCSYVRDVRQFDSYLHTAEAGTELPACTAEHIQRYMAYMAGHGKSSASMAREGTWTLSITVASPLVILWASRRRSRLSNISR